MALLLVSPNEKKSKQKQNLNKLIKQSSTIGDIQNNFGVDQYITFATSRMLNCVVQLQETHVLFIETQVPVRRSI